MSRPNLALTSRREVVVLGVAAKGVSGTRNGVREGAALLSERLDKDRFGS